MKGLGSIPTGGNFFHWIFFLFSHSKASAANIGIIAILVHSGGIRRLLLYEEFRTMPD